MLCVVFPAHVKLFKNSGRRLRVLNREANISVTQFNTVMNTAKKMCFISILVVKVPQKTLLMDALKEETEIVYDFCMCNPPFFANQLEAKVRADLPSFS